MLWTNTKRIFRSGFTNFWRGKAVAVASVFVLTIALFTIGALVIAAAFLNASLSEIERKVDISVSFKADVGEEDIMAMKKAIEQLPEVEEVIYKNRDEELNDFLERHKDNTLILQSLNEVGNPFGARLNIRADDPKLYEGIVSFIKNKDDSTLGGLGIIDQFSFKKDVVGKLVSVIAVTKKVGFAVSLFLIIMSVLVTFNTISLAIYTSREEISVMRLVGAGSNYVRGPFVVEGIIAGIFSSFIALALLYPAALWVRNATAGVYGGVDLLSYYFSNFPQLLLLLLLAGILTGALSSWLAIRKYLKV